MTTYKPGFHKDEIDNKDELKKFACGLFLLGKCDNNKCPFKHTESVRGLVMTKVYESADPFTETREKL